MKTHANTIKYSIVCGLAAAALHRTLLSLNVYLIVVPGLSFLPDVVALIIFLMLQLVPLFFLIGVQVDLYQENKDQLGLNVLMFIIGLFLMLSISPCIQLLRTVDWTHYKHWYECLPRVW